MMRGLGTGRKVPGNGEIFPSPSRPTKYAYMRCRECPVRQQPSTTRVFAPRPALGKRCGRSPSLGHESCHEPGCRWTWLFFDAVAVEKIGIGSSDAILIGTSPISRTLLMGLRKQLRISPPWTGK
jgi:hypothetical protein